MRREQGKIKLKKSKIQFLGERPTPQSNILLKFDDAHHWLHQTSIFYQKTRKKLLNYSRCKKSNSQLKVCNRIVCASGKNRAFWLKYANLRKATEKTAKHDRMSFEFQKFWQQPSHDDEWCRWKTSINVSNIFIDWCHNISNESIFDRSKSRQHNCY